jgi:TRAP-type C4-dicarboxylate transport system substrate-binding protein
MRYSKKALSIMLSIFLVAIFSITLLIPGCTSNGNNVEAIKLSIVSYFDVPTMNLSQFFNFINKINADANGELIVEYLGGPEVIPMFEQTESCISGVVDMVATFGATYESRVPEVAILNLSKMTGYGTHDVDVERRDGLYDYIRTAHEREGLYFIGRQMAQAPFYLASNVRIDSIDDFAGLQIGSGGIFHTRFIEGLGAGAVVLSGGERYTALEQGMIDASILSPITAISGSLFEVVDYVIEPAYKLNTNNVYIMNLEKWNSLPSHLQDIINEAAKWSEFQSDYFDVGVIEVNMRLMAEMGMEFITLPESEWEFYTSLYDADAWRQIEETFSTEEVATIKALTLAE